MWYASCSVANRTASGQFDTEDADENELLGVNSGVNRVASVLTELQELWL